MFRFIQTLLVKLEGLHDELKEKATKEIELGDYDVVDSLCGLLKSVEYHEDNLRTNPTDETVAKRATLFGELLTIEKLGCLF